MGQKKRIVLGQVGLGNWGPNLLRNFINDSLCEVRRVCDLRKSAFRKLKAEHPETQFSTDYRDVLRDPDIDAVVIATPSETHYPIGREALLAGKHLFVEKPLALSSTEAKKLVALSRKMDRILMVGHLLMYHPGMTALTRLVGKGKVGKLFYIGIRRRNLGRLQSGCSVLWDLGPHDVSLALMVVGKRPLSVVTTGGSFLQPGMPEVAFTTITFEGGILVHIEESWLSPRRERELVVVGEKGMLVFDELSSLPLKLFKKAVRVKDATAIREFDYLDGGTDPVEFPPEQPLEAECRHFLECVQGGAQPISGGDNGLLVLQVLEAAEKSLKAGGRVMPVDGGGRS